MKQYILKHKVNKVYLQIFDRGRHYVVDINKATRFTKQQANIKLKQFKHSENWEIMEVKDDKV